MIQIGDDAFSFRKRHDGVGIIIVAQRAGERTRRAGTRQIDREKKQCRRNGPAGALPPPRASSIVASPTQMARLAVSVMPLLTMEATPPSRVGPRHCRVAQSTNVRINGTRKWHPLVRLTMPEQIRYATSDCCPRDSGRRRGIMASDVKFDSDPAISAEWDSRQGGGICSAGRRRGQPAHRLDRHGGRASTFPPAASTEVEPDADAHG